MAKLEGVKVLDMQDGKVTKIEYEGEVYTKIDGVERKPKPGENEFEETTKFKAGDFAQVVGDTHFGGIKKGTVVEIYAEADYDDDIRFETLNGDDYDFAKAESLEKVNPTERELSFLRAGRNIGEFKEGDIVYVISDEYEDVVGKLVEVLSEPYGFSTGGNVEVEFDKSERIVLGNNLKLVAPVESRVDLIGEKTYA